MSMENCLVHHGILGMKWGVRRYQNADGSLTAEGKRHHDTYKEQYVNGKDEVNTNRTKKLYAGLTIGLTAAGTILGTIGSIEVMKQLDVPEKYRDYTNGLLTYVGGLSAMSLGAATAEKYKSIVKEEESRKK